MEKVMTLIIYACTFIIIFSFSYFLLPLIAEKIFRMMAGDASKRIGEKVQNDLRELLKSKTDSMVPELKNQVISHLVEPWLGRFADRCTNFIATQSSSKLLDKYGDVLVESIKAKRLIVSVMLGQFTAFAVVAGYYVHAILAKYNIG